MSHCDYPLRLVLKASGFYFAVQSGGTFDIDYVVMDPDDKVLLEGINERQGDFIFTANKVIFSYASQYSTN